MNKYLKLVVIVTTISIFLISCNMVLSLELNYELDSSLNENKIESSNEIQEVTGNEVEPAEEQNNIESNKITIDSDNNGQNYFDEDNTKDIDHNKEKTNNGNHYGWYKEQNNGRDKKN